jgi:hypothetical protein
MNALCTPTIATGALFVSLIFLDLLRHDYNYIAAHSIFGVVAVFLMAILCQSGASFVAWVFLIFPFAVLMISWGLMVRQSEPNPVISMPDLSSPLNNHSCVSCRSNPCSC